MDLTLQTLIKEIGDLCNESNKPWAQTEKVNNCLITTFHPNLSQSMQKFKWKVTGTRTAEINWKKKNKIREPMTPNFKIYQKARDIKSM